MEREALEDGRIAKQRQIKEKQRLDEIKVEKIKELKNLGVKEKYIADLQKYKIK